MGMEEEAAEEAKETKEEERGGPEGDPQVKEKRGFGQSDWCEFASANKRAEGACLLVYLLCP